MFRRDELILGALTVLACGLALTSTTVFAQQAAGPQPTVHEPIPNRPPAMQRPVFGAIQQSFTARSKILRQSYEGIDSTGSSCFCLPPDTNAAVGKDFVVETANTQIRIFNKSSGNVLLDEPLSTFFGAYSGGDPYVIYDDISERWYVSAFDSDNSGLFLAVSFDGNPLHGFLPRYDLTNLGGFPDFQKSGFNQDAIFISFNDFGSSGAAAVIASIDKAAAFSGTLRYFVSHPEYQFRGMPPAQMHHDKRDSDGNQEEKGGREDRGVEWFVSTDGGEAGNTMRVTKMTDYLTNSPNFTYTSVPVKQYQYASQADQPGGNVTTLPNTTTTQVQYHNGHLVTAMASSTVSDGFIYPKGLFYQIDVSGKTPVLLNERLVDPGAGVAVQMPSVDEDRDGNLGLTWMESSNNEYLSMWVGTIDRDGELARAIAATGGGFFFLSFRIGDYSTTVLDQTEDGKDVFWSANEYIGNDGSSNVWRTHITSFTAGHNSCSEGNDDVVSQVGSISSNATTSKPGGSRDCSGVRGGADGLALQ